MNLISTFLDTGNTDSLINEYKKIVVRSKEIPVKASGARSPKQRASHIRRSTQSQDFPTDRITPEFVNGVSSKEINRWKDASLNAIYSAIQRYDAKKSLSDNESAKYKFLKELYKYKGGKRG